MQSMKENVSQKAKQGEPRLQTTLIWLKVNPSMPNAQKGAYLIYISGLADFSLFKVDPKSPKRQNRKILKKRRG